jgi:glycosidase
MQISIFGAEVRNVLDQARAAVFKDVQVGNQSITIPSPFPSPEDWRDSVMYFLLVDRFNNPQEPPKHLPWDSVYSDFQGGTFNGIREQLDYLKALGIGAIWLSPVQKNSQYCPTYHGYGIQDFLSIEPRFASDPAQAKKDPQFVERELQQLVDEAHARGMYIIFDIVLHHAGDVFAYQNYGSVAPWNGQPYTISWRDENGNARSDWTEAPANPLPDAAVWPQELRLNDYFRRQGNAFGPSNQLIDASGDFYSLKGIYSDFQDSSGYPVHAILIRAYQYLIAKFDIDGYRIDTLKYISPEFARNFANNIREFALSIGKKNFFTFGEIYDNEQTIANFIGRNTLHSEVGDPIGVDAALDYPLFYNLPDACKGIGAPINVANLYELRKQVQSDILSSHGDASNFFVTFLDNHDQTSRYYYRDATNPEIFDDQVTLGVGCLYALPGIPCLYYGAEQGFSNSGEIVEAVREAFWGKPGAFDQHSTFYQAIAKLAALRNTTPVLRYGRYYFRPITEDGSHFGISTSAPGLLAFSRVLSDQELLIVANTNTHAAWQGEIIIDFSLNPGGTVYSVIFSNKAQPTVPGAIEEKDAGSVVVTEADGNVTYGPIRVVSVNVQPMEIQIVGKTG